MQKMSYKTLFLLILLYNGTEWSSPPPPIHGKIMTPNNLNNNNVLFVV